MKSLVFSKIDAVFARTRSRVRDAGLHRYLWGLPLLGALAACGGGGAIGGPPATGAPQGVVSPGSDNPLRDIGRLIFNDPALSVSGKMACVTCHDPAFGHASNPALGATIPGGPDLNTPGKRNVPAIGYLHTGSSLNLNLGENEIMGGFNWDGTANSLSEQAQRPFVTAHEMGPQTSTQLAARLASRPYAPDMRKRFGDAIFDNGDKALEAAAAAVAEFQLTDPIFRPFDSKFDAVNAGKASYTAQELRGLALFADPNKGNCASCHLLSNKDPTQRALLTDFGFDNLGVPRNPAIADNAVATFFDLGLCKHPVSSIVDLNSLCGAFKAPSLRNVAKTAPYFHNGKMSTLKEVLEFYVTRDLTPERWYGKRADGTVNLYDDVPELYKANVNRTIAPYNQTVEQGPALNAAEIDDVIAFMNTLSDGWKPPVALGAAAR